MATRKISAIEIASQISGVPLMVSDTMARLLADHIKAGGFFEVDESISEPFKEDDGLAIINIFGGLSHRAMGWFWRENYEHIRAQFQLAKNDPSIKKILLNFDTPGGMVAGCFDLVDEIYNARDEKLIFAFINEQATSAGYALASAAHRVFIPRTGVTGSVGVRMMHVDYSKMDERLGMDVTIIYAGARKIDFDDSKPLSEEAFKVGQTSVNKSYDLFVKTVSRNRPMSDEAVRATEAGIFEGADAVQIGFADAVMSYADAIETIKNY